MAYGHKQPIAAADYNTLAGLTGTAAGSSGAATVVAGHLYGVGYGDRGYGQTSPALTAVSSGRASASWSNLHTILSTLCSWQDTATTLLPPSGGVAQGAAVAAYPASETPSIPDLLVLLDTNRFNNVIGNMSLTSHVTDTRSTSWSASASSTLKAEFANESAARYFFNQGGEIRFTLGHTPTGTPQDADWNSLINGLCIAIRAHGAVQLSGPSIGTFNSVGFYELTTTYQPLITGTNIGGGAYSANDILIEVRSTSITGLNGGNGASVQIRVTLTDQHSGPVDSVSAGTTTNMASLRAASVLPSLPAAPTCTVVTAFG